MKATELRIGNWYDCHEGDEMNNTAIVQLRDIIWTNDGIGYELKHLNDRAVGVTLYPEKLKPIPLTEEWLERFGFEKDEEYDEGGLVDYRMILMSGSLEFVSFWNSEELTGVNQPQTGVDVEHVHQLQNLYFALAGEELNQNKEDE